MVASEFHSSLPRIAMISTHGYVNGRVRVMHARCAGREFIPKEYLHEHLLEWSEIRPRQY